MRNVAGGFLYQLYPWPVFSLFHPAGTHIAEPTGAVMPEILVIPLAVLLVCAGRAARRPFAMNLAVGWGLAALAPTSPFRYRFFSTASISQSRYYYLSSAGTVLAIVILLSMLWHGSSRVRRILAVAIFLLLSIGYVARDRRLEAKWDEFTMYYREIVTAIIEESDARPDTPRLAVEKAPMAFAYLEDAIVLERPNRTVFAVRDREEAERLAPCLHISYSGEAPKVMKVERIEGRPRRGGADGEPGSATAP